MKSTNEGLDDVVIISYDLSWSFDECDSQISIRMNSSTFSLSTATIGSYKCASASSHVIKYDNEQWHNVMPTDI